MSRAALLAGTSSKVAPPEREPRWADGGVRRFGGEIIDPSLYSFDPYAGTFTFPASLAGLWLAIRKIDLRPDPQI